MTADLRRFEYALEPIRRQRKWQLDSLQAELGQAQRRVQEAERALQELHRQLRDESEKAAHGISDRIDPACHPRALGWLVRLRERITAEEERVATLRVLREELRTACLRQQLKVDVIERHHEEAVAEFAQEEETRVATEADRDWLTRRGGLEHSASGGGR